MIVEKIYEFHIWKIKVQCVEGLFPVVFLLSN